MRSDTPLNHPVNIALKRWAAQHEITPAKLSAYTGFDRSHSSLLLNCKARVTDVTIGRLIRTFGPASLMPVLEALSEEGNYEHRASVS